MSTHISLLKHVLCHEFETRCGKWQCKKAEQKAFLFSFKTSLDYAKEDGYRYIDVVIYGEMNYVGVWIRKRWNVVALDDLNYGPDGEADGLKPGKKYEEGSGPWVQVANHDSCWREGVDTALRGFDIITFSTDVNGDWWKLANPKDLGIVRGVL